MSYVLNLDLLFSECVIGCIIFITQTMAITVEGTNFMLIYKSGKMASKILLGHVYRETLT